MYKNFHAVVTFRRKYLLRYSIWDISEEWKFITCLINLYLNKNLNNIFCMSPIDFQIIIYYDSIAYLYKQNKFHMYLFIFFYE